MKKLYNTILQSFSDLIVFLQVLKLRISENYALYKKKSIINGVIWDLNKKKIFNEFWEKAYGKKIKTAGHKLYEAINGVHFKEYIPDFLFATEVEPFFNDYFYAKFYSDKSLTELIYYKCEDVVFPKTYLLNCSGVFYNGNREVIGNNEAIEILSSLSEFVLKPTIGSNSGKGVMVCKLINGFDCINNFSINDLIISSNKDFIIQEKMVQHSSISLIYPHSINTFRTITYILDGKVHCAEIALRLGTGGRNIDNIHAGGLGIGVKKDGTLLEFAYKLGYSNSNEKLNRHPDTGVVFKDYKIEGIDRIIDCAIKMHGFTPHIGMISWDFMITSNGSPCLIEANYWGQAIWLTQIIHAKPFFGDNTNRLLYLIREQ